MQHALVEDVLPTIRAILQPGGTATGMRDQLVIKTSPENLAEIRSVLAAVDRAPKMLKISVTQDLAQTHRRSEFGVSGRVRSGDVRAGLPDLGSRGGANVSIGDGRGNSARLRALNSNGVSDNRNLHFVTTMEGSPAYIQTGRSQPFNYQNTYVDPYGVSVQRGTAFQETRSGFYVTPRTFGGNVTLELSPQLEKNSGADGLAVQRHATSSQVSGRLGEWINVGGASNSANDTNRALLSQARQRSSNSYDVWVMVEEMP